MSAPRLLYGVAPDGTLRHAAAVPGGAACGLRCPACAAPLVARQGRSVRAHLAHAEHSPCVEADAADLGVRGAAATLLQGLGRLRLPEIAAFAGEAAVEVLRPAQEMRFEPAEAARAAGVGGTRADLRIRRAGREMAVLLRTRRPAPAPAVQGAAAAGASVLEVWIPPDADPPALLEAAADTGFRSWRAHRLAGPRIAPDLPSEAPFDRLPRADRARAVRLLAVPAPPAAAAPIAHPLIGGPLPHDGLMGEAPAAWQARILGALALADGPLDRRTLGRLLRPPPEARGRWSPALRQALRAARLRHPWAVLDAWLRAAVEARLLAQAPGGGYLLGETLSAHDRLALAAAGSRP